MNTISGEIKKCLLEKLIFPDDSQLQQRGIADKIEQSCNDILTEKYSTKHIGLNSLKFKLIENEEFTENTNWIRIIL